MEESRTLFLMTSLQYYCIVGLAEIKALHPRDNKIMRKTEKMQVAQITKSLWNVRESGCIQGRVHKLKIKCVKARSRCNSIQEYYINITFPERVIVENIIPGNVIINRGAAEVDNHITRDDIFDYHPLRECNIYFIIPNRTLDPLFPTVCFLLDLPW